MTDQPPTTNCVVASEFNEADAASKVTDSDRQLLFQMQAFLDGHVHMLEGFRQGVEGLTSVVAGLVTEGKLMKEKIQVLQDTVRAMNNLTRPAPPVVLENAEFIGPPHENVQEAMQN